MVPDVHHMLTKGGGIFCNPMAPSAPAKLRLLYECVPLSIIVEAAGGTASNGKEAILDLPISSTDLRTQICLGSTEEVQRHLNCLT